MEPFGIEAATSLALLAVANGIIRKRDRFDFARWLAVSGPVQAARA